MSSRLKREIWKILLEKGSGMIHPEDLEGVLKKKGVKCSWEKIARALECLEEEKKISFGTLGVIWLSRKGVR